MFRLYLSYVNATRLSRRLILDNRKLLIHLDHVGPMEATHKKYNHTLVVVDAFSKIVWLYPTQSTGTEDVIKRRKRQPAVLGNP